MLGSIAGRLTIVILGYFMLFGVIFNLSLDIPSLTVQSIVISSAPLITFGVMLAVLVGVGVGSHSVMKPFYNGDKFWQHVTAAAVTANVLIAAQSIQFGAVATTVASVWEYGTTVFGAAMLGLTIAGVILYVRVSDRNEDFIKSLVSVVSITIAATILFALADLWILVALLVMTGGFYFANRGEGKHKLSGSVSDISSRQVNSH